MELQGIYDELFRAGYALYAVSYDSADVLRAFSEKHEITYPLLSDEGSRVIQELGLLNEDAPPPVAGIPHPGTFVLNADGTVRKQAFLRELPRTRHGCRGAGASAGHRRSNARNSARGGDRRSSGHRAARQRLDAWGQRVWLRVQLDIAPGLHVYGQPIPDGYYPLEVSEAPIERVVVGTPQFPAATPFRIAGLEEQFVVYDGSVRVELPLTFMTVDAGTLTVAVTVSYRRLGQPIACLQRRST